ncbi:MAG: integrase arm-type DNA-binding domain-containing protein [Micavibrio aeruginosavorus]|uniref:Integrase arm-type DNA-binding domain-containing protein n=1 Tax=Micavibrio aeruginosavorus TaxID=349221 RepID=A0A7T5R110_9BACT|nr:MAG: integrase arm-type DNA-binding domain-containing protein [Micavibrio aeruginosavorus]
MLTDKACRAAIPESKPKKIFDSQGLYLEVLPAGGKYWRLKYRYRGKEKRLALGVYPNISLAEARQRRDKAKRQLEEGIDPSFSKKEEKRLSKESGKNTFECIAREWHDNSIEGWDSRYAVTVMKRLESDVFPSIGHMPINSIRAPELLEIVRKIEKRKAYEIAHRAIQTCNQVFRYAVITGRTDRNPALDFRGVLKTTKTKHFAAIDSSDLPDFLAALEQNDARLYVARLTHRNPCSQCISHS